MSTDSEKRREALKNIAEAGQRFGKEFGAQMNEFARQLNERMRADAARRNDPK